MLYVFHTGRLLCQQDALRALEAWRGDGFLYVDLEEPTLDEAENIGLRLGLHADAIEDCMTGQQLPRIDEYGDHVFCICYGFLEDASLETAFEKLTIACGRSFVLSAHLKPLVTTGRLRHWLESDPTAAERAQPSEIFYRLFDGTVDRLVEAADRLDERIEQIETDSLEVDPDGEILSRITGMRPHVSTLRHIAVREREAIEPLCRGELDYIAGGLERRFNHVRDHLSRVIAQADTSRDRLAAARENLRAAQADQLNSIMKTLTVFATILLPLSVITGIYGMNVPLWPNPEHPATFWGILATMICLVFGLLAYFRRRNWI